MNISVAVSGHGQLPGSNLSQCTLTVQFDGPVESMTLTVVIAAEPAASIEARAIARAKELAQQFAWTA
jgi:hypothetical protein